MSQGQLMSPLERRSFKEIGLIAAANASVNTGILAFTNAPVASNPASGLAPVVGGTVAAAVTAQAWALVASVAEQATLGFSVKFLHKGTYMIDVVIPKTSADTNLTHVGLSLDCLGANLLAAAAVNDPVVMEDYDILLQVAATQTTHHLHAIFRITDTLASSTALAANGTPVGSVRLHGNNGAGAITASTAFVDANVALYCQQVNEIFS